MTRRLTRFVDSVLDDHDLSIDSYAGQRVDEEVTNDPAIRALFDAVGEVDHRQNGLRDEVAYDESPRSDLKDARRTCEETARALADHIVEDVCRTTLGGHDVDLRHATRLDCPACGEDDVEAFYLGSRPTAHGSEPRQQTAAGYVCGWCETDVEQVMLDGEVDETRVVDGDRVGDEPHVETEGSR